MITCCDGCVPPKRTATCHFDGTCPEYIAAQIVHEAEREKEYKEKLTQYGLSAQAEKGVRRADKKRRKARC